VKAFIEEGKDVRLGDWKAAEVEILNSFQLLTAKPVVYLVYITWHENGIMAVCTPKFMLYFIPGTAVRVPGTRGLVPETYQN
ncbi:obg-like ATPase 1-like protein, partial [Trifolium pratense]